MDEEISTLNWLETTQICGRPIKTRVWMRSTPPAMARIGGICGQRMILDANGHRMTHNLLPYVMMLNETPHVQFGSPNYAGLAPVEATTADDAATPWKEFDYEDNGTLLKRRERRSMRNNFEIEEVIISFHETRRIVSKTTREYELESHALVSETVYDDFRYNEEPPKGTFDMPRWKPVHRDDTTKFKAEHMPDVTDENIRSKIGVILSTLDSAWVESAWNTFASLWRFGTYDRLPKESEWKDRFDRHAHGWTNWASAIDGMNQQEIIFIPESSKSFQMMPVRRPVVLVRTTLRASRSEGHSWSGEVEYYLDELDGDYRVVYANLPLREIENRTLA